MSERSSAGSARRGLVPYLFYDDIEKMLEWYARVFGFVEIKRWTRNGRIENAEMAVGDTELWLDGGGSRYFDKEGQPARGWIGVWVDDPDSMHQRLTEAGIIADAPEDKPWGVRLLTVKYPEGYSWGFMRRQDP